MGGKVSRIRFPCGLLIEGKLWSATTDFLDYHCPLHGKRCYGLKKSSDEVKKFVAIDKRIKKRASLVLKLRKDNPSFGLRKLAKKLEDDYNIKISHVTIDNIIKESKKTPKKLLS